METSIGHIALIRHTADIQQAVKEHLVSLGANLVSNLRTDNKGGIQGNTNKLSQFARITAAELVELVQVKVRKNSQSYHTFVAVLEKDKSRYSSILDKLKLALNRQQRVSAGNMTSSDSSCTR